LLEQLEDRLAPAIFSVNALADSVDADPDVTSLREAISAANANPGDDTITFDPSLTATSPATITLTRGQLSLSGGAAITINGPGADRLAISGGSTSRVFQVPSGLSATLSGLSLVNGQALFGSGILNDGTLTLDFCNVSNNGGLANFGAIYNTGTLTLSHCTVSNNTAFNPVASQGGGISTSAR
jgi:CSLREA domain-containing protein